MPDLSFPDIPFNGLSLFALVVGFAVILFIPVRGRK